MVGSSFCCSGQRPSCKARPGTCLVQYLPEQGRGRRDKVRWVGSPRGGRWPGGGSRDRRRSEVRRTRGLSGRPGRRSPRGRGVRVRQTPRSGAPVWPRLPVRCTQTGRRAGRRCRGPGRPPLPAPRLRQAGRTPVGPGCRRAVRTGDPGRPPPPRRGRPGRTGRGSSNPA